ncbi:3,4-dihydroxyphenylacetate 2,3-dioxygenase [Microbacterium paludicola]|uniref:3,4-dihydroxyphenylacetate 2,3-dioxygenase n=1 Tax=Microbacterium paludicola TaxID=300019 RepID=A0ABU1I524_9MICO|nr:3,4-dihydroxyphenylacetate 2,3-dioxygenase [Microbacterium paludicola]
MTHRDQMTRTSSGYFVSQEAPITCDDPIPTPTAPAPDILRCAYMELVVTDLAASREFYVDVLGLYVTEEDDEAIYLRSTEEFIHHNLILRQGPVAAVAAFSYRVRSADDLDRAVEFYTELGCRVERRPEGFVRGIGDSVRVEDPLGFPYEFFFQTEHVERLSWRYDLHTPGELVRLDHFNQVTPDVPRAVQFMQSLGFRVTEDIQDDAGTVYAAWMRRKPTVHDTAMTGGDGPRMHHVAFATHEKHNILAICDKLGALRRSDAIERGPGAPRRLERVLPLPARPRRTPGRDLHAGLLHRRPRQSRRHMGRARQPAPRLVGQPRRPLLVHRGLARPRPRRESPAAPRPHR